MTTRFWIGMLAVVGALVCALTLLFALPRVDAGAIRTKQDPVNPAQTVPAPSSGAHAQSYEGIITDSRCGAKHSAAVGLGAADCTRACVHSGEHFALVDGDKTYALEGDESILKRAAGQRVRIVGTLNDKTIAVASVTAGSA